MKKILTISLLLFAGVVFAQEVKMEVDWEKSKQLAKKEDKQILVILTGSEWCKPCKKMDQNVLANPLFQKYADQNLIIFLVDLPGGGLVMNSPVYKSYEKFKKMYQAPALPSLILTDKDGNKIKLLEGKMFQLENVLGQLKGKHNSSTASMRGNLGSR